MPVLDRYKKISTAAAPEADVTELAPDESPPLPRAPIFKRLLKWFGMSVLKFGLMILVLMLVLAIYQTVMG